MSVPTKIIITGDKVSGSRFIRDGHRQMEILENLMDFQELDQYSIRREITPGVLIIATKVFGLRTLDIIIGGGPLEKRKQERYCLCFPHFAFGVIEKAYPTYPVKGEDPETGAPMAESQEAFESRMHEYKIIMLTTRVKYDVHICFGDKYALVEDVYDANFGVYYPGQYVLVSMGDEMEEWDLPLDCQRVCLMSDPRFNVLIVSPLHVMNNMNEWQYLPEKDDV